MDRGGGSSAAGSGDYGYAWMVGAAANGFHAARQRYRRRRSSRSSSGGDSENGPSCSASGGVMPVQRRIASKYSGRQLNLDDEQCETLADAFFHIPDKYYAFEQMFLRLFVHDDPEVALVFDLQGVPELELRRRTRFRTHVCKFQRFMTTVMDLLTKRDREEELIQIIRMVGRQHCNVKQLSFTASRWLSFKGALMATFAKNDQDKNYAGWSILISFLIYEIKDAFLAHIRQLRSSSLPEVLETYKLEFRRSPAPTPTTANAAGLTACPFADGSAASTPQTPQHHRLNALVRADGKSTSANNLCEKQQKTKLSPP